MKKLWLLVLLGGLLLVAVACAPSAPVTPAAPAVVLPKEAVKLSDVVPAMGEHWANPANLPLGPIYLVYKDKVIGIEYMFNNDSMKEIAIPTPAGPVTMKDLPGLPVNAKIDHMDVTYLPQGHEGYLVAHYDIHLYFITTQEQAAVLPEAAAKP